MSVQRVEYFGMTILAVNKNGVWYYATSIDDEPWVPFAFQQYVCAEIRSNATS